MNASFADYYTTLTPASGLPHSVALSQRAGKFQTEHQIQVPVSYRRSTKRHEVTRNMVSVVV